MFNIYIASPFFNPAQVSIVEMIEKLCSDNGLSYYSPRTHSGSHRMTVEEKKNYSNWEPVFDRNADAIGKSDYVLAVISYELPSSQKLVLKTTETVIPECREADLYAGTKEVVVNLPDNGTVWEMGYARALNQPVIGYHPQEIPKNLNLMLSHGCNYLVCGESNLKEMIEMIAHDRYTAMKKFNAKVMFTGDVI